ncbi:hypothetical protein [Myxococcus sp. Y35]|uniref:hypothetical protein n=1 Tax=Pseudomyxococcus flavus TaxID=3115648 RepID=UPI003CEEF875
MFQHAKSVAAVVATLALFPVTAGALPPYCSDICACPLKSAQVCTDWGTIITTCDAWCETYGGITSDEGEASVASAEQAAQAEDLDLTCHASEQTSES